MHRPVLCTRRSASGVPPCSEVSCCGRYRGALHCLQSGLQAEGPAFLFRGLTSTILRAFPTNAATFAAVAWTMRLLEDRDLVGAVKGTLKDSVKDTVYEAPLHPKALHLSLYADYQHPFLEGLALPCHLVASEL